MSFINPIFPSSVYIEENILEPEKIKKIFNKIIDLSEKNTFTNNLWKCNVNSSHNSNEKINIHEDEDFDELKKIVKHHVNNFATVLESDHDYNCDYSWFNVYDKTSYQEFHFHSNSIFSAVYFLSFPDESSPLIFEKSDIDMFPLKKIKNFNSLNSQSYTHFPSENSLVIFRSNLRHMVPMGNNIDYRITLSYNFS